MKIQQKRRKSIFRTLKTSSPAGRIKGVMIACCLLLLVSIRGWAEDQQPAEEVIECQRDFSCFVSAGKKCSPARVDYVMTLNIFGVLQRLDTHYELQKSASGQCILTHRTNNVSFNYSDDILKALKEKGVTQEQIDQQLEQISEPYQRFIGKDNTCTGDPAVIVNLLEKTAKGTFSVSTSSPWPKNLECSGPSYEQMNTGTAHKSAARGCFVSKDCANGFHCMNGECISNAVLDSLQNCPDHTCSQECTDCKKGRYLCMQSPDPLKNEKCVECFGNLDCKDGYTCRSYQCAKE